MKISTILLAVLLCMVGIYSAHADNVYTSPTLGYSMYLPDNWIVESVSDSQDFMYDTTGTYGGLLSIIRQHRNTLDYAQPQDWVRAYFIAYLLVAQYSYDPWGAILYRDSSTTCTQGDLWAPEAFGRFYSLDTALGSWSEFVRFTANDEYGYQLFAMSDTADMDSNLTTYAALLYGIDIESSANVASYRPVAPVAWGQGYEPRMMRVALSGRVMSAQRSSNQIRLASGLVCAPGFKLLTGTH